MSMQPFPSAPGQPAPDKYLFGGWADLAAAFGRAVGVVPGLQAAPALVDVLVALLSVQDSQSGLLKSIKADTAAIRSGPFKEAMESLEDARRVGPADTFWSRYIDRAEDRLSQAFSFAADDDLRGKAQIQYNRAVVHVALRREDDTRYYLGQSAQLANQVVDGYVRKAGVMINDARPNARPVKRHEWSNGTRRAAAVADTAAAIVTLGTWWFFRQNVKEATVDAIRLSYCKELEQFIGFYNLIQHSSSFVLAGRKPEYLSLVDTSRQEETSYTLRSR
jgi:hypothetical protein